MSRIKGKETKAEVVVRKYLFANGFRYHKNVRQLPGIPDIVLPKYKTCIFINGCFWHGHKGCPKFVVPETNTTFWLNKINKNRDRDNKINSELMLSGWKVIAIWECELTASKRSETLESLIKQIKYVKI